MAGNLQQLIDHACMYTILLYSFLAQSSFSKYP